LPPQTPTPEPHPATTHDHTTNYSEHPDLRLKGLTTAEKEELQRLRRENREQQQTIEILKKANFPCN
ncbi:hypothetical protein, partial [Streptomyces mirabilis]